MKKQMSGFTLIELMIVVAIIGILAAIALPAYQDYTIRAKVSECAMVAASCKTAVSETFASNGSLPTNETVAGCATTSTQYCAAPTVAAGAVTVAVSGHGGTPDPCNLVLTPQLDAGGNAITQWNGSTTCDGKHVPANFR
ncbi:pilin [Magnetovirga frankeli]|uniref:pilin n=1 Tax=Magnetovirga frankeli TaxID=947516 RepID=UPI001293F018|nr:pilin [gamma proteobacterium SS-5]